MFSLDWYIVKNYIMEDWERVCLTDRIYLMEEQHLLMKEIMEEETVAKIIVVDKDNILKNDDRIDSRTLSATNEERLFFGFDIPSKTDQEG